MSQKEGFSLLEEPFPLQQQDITQEYVISRYDSEAHSSFQNRRDQRQRTYPESPNYRRLLNFQQLEETELNLITEIVENFTTQIGEHDFNTSRMIPLNITSYIGEQKDRLPVLLSKLKSRSKGQHVPEEPERMSCIIELEDWKARFQAEKEEVIKLRNRLNELELDIEVLRNNQAKGDWVETSICSPIRQNSPLMPPAEQCGDAREEPQRSWLFEKEALIKQHEQEIKLLQQSDQAKINQLLEQILVLKTNHRLEIQDISDNLQKEKDKATILQLENANIQQEKRGISYHHTQSLAQLQRQYSKRIEAAELENFALKKSIGSLEALVEATKRECQDKISSLQLDQKAYKIDEGLSEKLALYQSLIKEKTQKENEWKYAIEQLQLQIHRKCLKIEELEIMAQSKQLEQARSTILKLEAQNQRLSTGKDALQRELQIYQKSIQEISILDENKERQLATLKALSQASIEEKEQEMASLREQLERKNGVIELLIEEKEDLMIEVERMKGKQEELQATLGTHLNKANHIEVSQKQMKIKSEQLSKVLESKANKLEKQVARLTKEITQSKKVARLETERLKQLLDQKKSELEQAYLQNQQLKSQADPEISSICQLSTSIMRIQGEKSKEVKEKYISEFFQKLKRYKKTLSSEHTLQLKNQIAFILS